MDEKDKLYNPYLYIVTNNYILFYFHNWVIAVVGFSRRYWILHIFTLHLRVPNSLSLRALIKYYTFLDISMVTKFS